MLQGPQPFAVFLYNFTDSAVPQPFTIQALQSAWHTISNFWSYNSLGMISTEGSTLFDWQTVPLSNADFRTTANGRQAAVEYIKTLSKIDTSKYVGFIVIFSDPIGDAYSQGTDAVFEPTICATALICHEMHHMFGEAFHAFDYSGRQLDTWDAPGEYCDQTDIMSAGNCWSSNANSTDQFSGAGPNLNMMWRDQWGWLLPAAIARVADHELGVPYGTSFTLGARNYDTGQGLRCVQFLDIYVEVAFNDAAVDNFDAGLPSSGVLIHRKVASPDRTVPYVIVPDLADDRDQKFWFAGQVCALEGTGDAAGVPLWLWIKSIEPAGQTADIELSNQYPPPLTSHQVVGIRKMRSSGMAGPGSEYIEYIGVRNPDGATVPIRRDVAIGWIEAGRNSFYVVGKDGSQGPVMIESHWLKTRPDGDLADNLQALSEF